MEPIRYQTAPVELPIDPWLLNGTPAEGCKVCEALAEQREHALKLGNQGAAFDAAAEIRNHPHGGRS
jgi:hypothetical protein